MSTRPSTARRLLAAVLLSSAALAGCGDSTAASAGLAFTIQPPIASMVVGQQRDVVVAWASEIPADAQAQWEVRPDTIARLLAASTAGATIDARRAGTALVTLTVTSQGRAVARDMVLEVSPLACALIGPLVSPASVTTSVGGRVRLTVTRIQPPPCGSEDGRADFRMLDTSIATVDSLGEVTGRRIGATALIVSARGRPGLTTAVSVSVVGGGGVPITPAVQPSVVDIAVGDTLRLRGTFPRPPNAPNQSTEVRFGSADTTIAAVDAGGLLRGVRAGQTFVRATAVADSSIWTAVPVTVRAR